MARLVLQVLLAVTAITWTSGAWAASEKWLEVEIGIIGTASDDILKSAIDRVEKEKLSGLLVILDTPGGALDATRSMVKAIMKATFSIVVWVGPSGSRAGSAGAFITLAANVAAMAPGTNIGAAHPINADGSDLGESDGAKKIEEDTAAFMESIAVKRGRNLEMAKAFVLASNSVTADEALENKVIDLIAADTEDIFRQLDGKTYELPTGEKRAFRTAGAAAVAYERSLKQEILQVLSNPNIFYLLFIAGLIGIGFELTHPGVLFPGVAGGISMILALIATSVLPVSMGAMLLLLAGVAFMVGEIFLPSFGVLGIGGFLAFLIGSFLLVDPSNAQGLRISLYTIGPGAAALALALLVIGYLVLRSGRAAVVTGAEAMIGKHGKAVAPFTDGCGQVRIEGEIWNARVMDASVGDLGMGDAVGVVGMEGLTLCVKRV